MPNIATQLFTLRPVMLCNPIRDGTCCIVLVAAHDFKSTVSGIGNRVETNELVRHGNREQVMHNIAIIVLWFVVTNRPSGIGMPD